MFIHSEYEPPVGYELVKIFSNSKNCCFDFLTVFFALQKLFNFTSSYLLMVVISDCAIVFCSGVMSYQMCSKLFLTCSSVRVSVSSYMLRCLINLDLSFMQGDTYE